MSATERLISSDDHVDLAHDNIKSFLASKHHADYDDALGRFQAHMAKSMSAEMNNRWREQEGIEGEGVSLIGSLAGTVAAGVAEGTTESA